MEAFPPVLFLLLLPLASQNPVRSPQSLLDILGKDLAALLSAAEWDSATSLPHGALPQLLNGQPPRRDTPGHPTPLPDDAWVHFFNDFINTQKKFRGRSKKVSQQGCFGIKLDRIGTLSGLGC